MRASLLDPAAVQRERVGETARRFVELRDGWLVDTTSGKGRRAPGVFS